MKVGLLMERSAELVNTMVAETSAAKSWAIVPILF
jgi:hypothetical protein